MRCLELVVRSRGARFVFGGGERGGDGRGGGCGWFLRGWGWWRWGGRGGGGGCAERISSAGGRGLLGVYLGLLLGGD